MSTTAAPNAMISTASLVAPPVPPSSSFSTATSAPHSYSEPAPSSRFLSNFIPALVVGIYVLLAIYGAHATVSSSLARVGGVTNLSRRWRRRCARLLLCKGRRTKHEGYANVPMDVEGECAPLAAQDSRASGSDDGHCVQELVPMELLRAPPPTDGPEPDPESQLQPQPPHSRTVHAHRPRRKRPAPLSLHLTRPQLVIPDTLAEDEDDNSANANVSVNVVSPTSSLDVRNFFDACTGRLRDDIILRPATGLEALCESAPRPAPVARGYVLSATAMGEWAAWTTDRVVEWVLGWLEGTDGRSGNGGAENGGGRYQIVPSEEDGVDMADYGSDTADSGPIE